MMMLLHCMSVLNVIAATAHQMYSLTDSVIFIHQAEAGNVPCGAHQPDFVVHDPPPGLVMIFLWPVVVLLCQFIKHACFG